MGSEGLVQQTALSSPPQTNKAKTYSRIKLTAGIISSVFSFSLLFLLVACGITRDIESWARSVLSHDYGTLLVFGSLIGLAETVVTLPIGFYSGYIIEHRYQLSNQSVGKWIWERLKEMLVSLPIAIGLVALLFFCLRVYGSWWWLPVAAAVTLLSVVLARLAPVLIMPLFYKFTPIENGSLKEKILRLCSNAGLRIEGIFSFDLSKNTQKANAGFTGIGKSKRIILGDTLVKEFTENEIETVFAHELGHYKFHHILIGILLGSVSTFMGLFVTAQLFERSITSFGFSSITDIAALPLLPLWLSLFGLVTVPLGNVISRHHERQADSYAVRATGNKHAFVAALRKLASTNLADADPHPLVEFLFYSHPSISKRINMVESVRTR